MTRSIIPKEALINSTNEMKCEAHGTQQPRHINLIGEGVSTAQQSNSLVQSINQRFPNDLIASYLHTDYQISIHNEPICLRINHYLEPLAHLLRTTQQACGAIISAYNPQSTLQSDEDNARAHQLLQDYLRNQGYAITESLHKDPAEQWPNEKGFFVIGVNLDDARSIGQQFNQNAIVWIGSDAIPRLILLN